MLGRPRPELSVRRTLTPLATALVSLGLLAPAAAAAAGAEGPLNAELEALATPAVAAQAVPAQAEAVGLPAEGPGSLSREGGRVVVEARFESGTIPGLETLRAAGAKVLADRDGTVAVSIEPEDLEGLAAVPGLGSVTPALRPVVHDSTGSTGTFAATANGLCEGGSVISQGMTQLNVSAARAAFNARGAGITVGVISNSFDSATSSLEGGPLATRASGDEVSNDLPGGSSTCSGEQVPVDVIAEAPTSPTSESTDEGRAMLQIVHDLAPHAKLAFATALPSELVFARNIERLAEPVSAGGAGAQVIVDDIGYLSEPFYQEGPVAVAVRRVTEEGVTYLTAAGNENIVESGTEHYVGSFEASAYRSTSCPSAVTGPLGSQAPTSCMNFAPSGQQANSKFGISVVAGGTAIVDLQWAEPWYGVGTDLNAYLVNSSGQILTDWEHGEGTERSTAAQRPVELLGWENTGSTSAAVYLVVGRCSGSCNAVGSATRTPRLKFEFVGEGVNGVQYPTSGGGNTVGPTIYGHAGAAAAISVGAIRYTESGLAPKSPETFSSRGPVTHYFGPVEGSVPASALGSAEVIAKPDLTATDCASTTFFAQYVSGAWHFCGTSEAAPHAAAIAALMKQTSPLASPAAIEAAMKSSATAYAPASSANSAEAVGAGLLNAAGALGALGGSPVDDPASSVVPALSEETAPPPPPVVTPSPAPQAASHPSPTVELTAKPASPTDQKRPSFEFKASVPATFACRIDGGTAQPCTSPFVVPTPLGDGAHTFVVTATATGGGSASTSPYDFTVDTKAPSTTFVKKPGKVLRTSAKSIVARFGLKSSESPVTFYCQVDRAPLRICPASFAYRFGKGAHVVKVKAKDAAGNLATAWTTYSFRVKLLHRAHPRGRRSLLSGG